MRAKLLPNKWKQIAKGRPVVMLPLCLFSDDTSGNRYNVYKQVKLYDINVRPQFYLTQKFLGGNGTKAIIMGHLGNPRGWMQEHTKLKCSIILRFTKSYLSYTLDP